MRPLPPPTRVTRVTNAATGVTLETFDYRGSQNLPKRPLVLECDYCTEDAYRLWCRPTRAHGVELAHHRYTVYEGGSWNACADCKPFVDARDLDGLARRVAAATGIPREWFEKMHGVVFECQEGAEIVWSSGDEYPVVPRAAKLL
jgi:hypothetical protein